jgi:hypothetical protein
MTIFGLQTSYTKNTNKLNKWITYISPILLTSSHFCYTLYIKLQCTEIERRRKKKTRVRTSVLQKADRDLNNMASFSALSAWLKLLCRQTAATKILLVDIYLDLKINIKLRKLEQSLLFRINSSCHFFYILKAWPPVIIDQINTWTPNKIVNYLASPWHVPVCHTYCTQT